jgi:hypothetical protein
MSLNDPFFIELDSISTDSVDTFIYAIDLCNNNVSMKEESGNSGVSAPCIKIEPFTKHPTFADDDKENMCNNRPPFHQKTGTELAVPRYGKPFHHPNTAWSVKDTVILVRTAEARMSWEKTMKLLPKKTSLAS